MVKRSSALLGVAALLVGCSALTSFDALESKDGGRADGAVPVGADGSTSGDGSASAGDGGVASDAQTSDDAMSTSDGGAGSDGGSNGNLVENPGFENGSGGCGTNWGNGYGQTAMRASPGRAGMYACDVCISMSASTSYQINSIKAIPVTAGNYYAEAYITTPEGGVTTNAGVQVYFTGDGGISNCNGNGSTYCQGTFVMAAPGAAFSSSTVSFVVTGAGSVTLDLHSYTGNASSCFLIDDVALYAQ